MQVRRMTESDIGSVAQMTAARFMKDPKTMVETRGIEDAERYFAAMIETQLRFYQKKMDVYVLDNLEGVIAGHLKSKLTLLGYVPLGIQMLRTLLRFPRPVSRKLRQNMAEVGNVMHMQWKEKYHRGEYVYIALVCVAKSMKGTGAFRALMESILGEADQMRIPVFLDAHNAANVPIYQHFGFEVVETHAGKPESGISQFCMMRKVLSDSQTVNESS